MIFDLDHIWIFLCLLPLVAFFYASVGHGGASGFLALMALFSFSPALMKPTALILNLFVAGIAFIHFFRAGYFKKELFIPFAVASIPFAFLGGSMEIDASLYKKILGILLVIAVLKMLNVFGKDSDSIQKIKFWQGLIIGSGIGFISGLIGIGGGIILTPIIVLLHWGKMKEAAAVSTLFIWVNSAAGLLGQLSIGVRLELEVIALILLALIGGYFGAYFGSKKWSNANLRYVLAIVLIMASIKLYVF